MSNKKLIIIMVGLPARGKSYISNNLAKYLNWMGLKTKVFNSGNSRRSNLEGIQTSDFFDPNNKACATIKENISIKTYNELLNWTYLSGDIGIFDSTNSTPKRREYLVNESEKYIDNKETVFDIIFIEVKCNNKIIINKNILLKQLTLDYKNTDNNTAIEDFNQRIKYYEKIYTTINIDKCKHSFISLDRDNDIITSKSIRGGRKTIIMDFLLNLRISNSPIYLSRHGESLHNVAEKLGGDSKLSERGAIYSKLLFNYMKTEINDMDKLKIFTSSLKRTKETVALFNNHTPNKILDEINAGVCSNMTIRDISEKYPDILKCRSLDKLNYRYPEGESYRDICIRIRSFIYELESRNSPILVVGHRAINRVLLAYFLNINVKDMPHIEINLGEVIKLTPSSKGYIKEIIKLED